MIFLFDHLAATIIGATAIFILAALMLRVGEVNVEQVANYHVKTQAADFATWLEDDLLTMGKNRPYDLTNPPFENPVDSSGFTTNFVFYWDSVTTSPVDTIRYSIRYELEKRGTRVVGSDTISVFRLARYQREDAGSWVQSGSSSDLLSSFRIQMLNRDAVPLSDPKSDYDEVWNTRVRFSMATPFDTQNSTIRQVFYGSTLMISR